MAALNSAKCDHAVVIGASIAGLAAARVLSDHFNRVTVLERDILPDEPGPRKAIPQGHHVHALLMRGLLDLEALFPGFERDMAARGVPFADPMADTKLFLPYGWAPRTNSTSRIMLVSRDYLEGTIRQRVKATAGIRFVEGVRVQGLVHAGGAVTGVRLHADDDGAGDVLSADLIVDATGRTSAAPKWLAEHGYDAPTETTIDAAWGYASRFYRLLPGQAPDWSLGLSLPNVAAETRGGVIALQEGNRVIHTVFGAANDHPPTDEQGFLDFSRSIGNPELARTIADAEPVSDIHSYRLPASRIRHYEKLRRRPERFVLLGDAVLVTNPLFGEGMTVAIMGARLLGRQLEAARRRGRGLDGLAGRYQKKLARQNILPWVASTSNDYQCPSVTGTKQPAFARWAGQYAERLHILSYQDPAIATKMFEVQQLVRSPLTLGDPRYMVRVVAGWRRLTPTVKSVEQRRQRPPLDVRHAAS